VKSAGFFGDPKIAATLNSQRRRIGRETKEEIAMTGSPCPRARHHPNAARTGSGPSPVRATGAIMIHPRFGRNAYARCSSCRDSATDGNPRTTSSSDRKPDSRTLGGPGTVWPSSSAAALCADGERWSLSASNGFTAVVPALVNSPRVELRPQKQNREEVPQAMAMGPRRQVSKGTAFRPPIRRDVFCIPDTGR
jgi:hypothetical protein